MAVPIHSGKDDVIASINIIPFVDIVLVLLIIFMVTSTAIVKAAIKVDLPRAAAAGTQVESTINLVLTLNKELLLNGESYAFDAASREIAKRAKENPNIQAVISADKKIDYGEVIEVIDLIKQSGVNTFALNIEREQLASLKE